jgi:hypothetical protein
MPKKKPATGFYIRMPGETLSEVFALHTTPYATMEAALYDAWHTLKEGHSRCTIVDQNGKQCGKWVKYIGA